MFKIFKNVVYSCNPCMAPKPEIPVNRNVILFTAPVWYISE